MKQVRKQFKISFPIKNLSSIHCQKFLQQETFFLEGTTKTFQCKEVVQKPSKGL